MNTVKFYEFVRQFSRFLVVGGLSFCVDFGLFLLLFSVGMPRIPANITSFSVSLIVNYILSRMFVFEAAKDVKIAKEFTAYVGLNAIALGLNTLILELCVTWIHLSAPAGKIIATGIVLIYNFFSRKMLIEKLSKRNNN